MTDTSRRIRIEDDRIVLNVWKKKAPTWLAMLTGPDPKYRAQRVFVDSVKLDDSEAHYPLRDGIYHGSSPDVGLKGKDCQLFFRVAGDSVMSLTRDAAYEAVNAAPRQPRKVSAGPVCNECGAVEGVDVAWVAAHGMNCERC